MTHRIISSAILLWFCISWMSLQAVRADERVTPEIPLVKLPLAAYDRLVEEARHREIPKPIPSTYILGKASLHVTVQDAPVHPAANVTMLLELTVIEPGWISVPILPPGVAVISATVGDLTAKLSSTAQGVFWNTDQPGNYRLAVKYKSDVLTSEGGYSISVPTAQAASIVVDGVLPSGAVDLTVIPSAGAELTGSDEAGVRFRAAVPTSAGFQLSWKSSATNGFAISRADYRGVLQANEQSINWSGDLTVDSFSKDPVRLSLLPTLATLNDVRADGKPSPVFIEGDRFVTKIRGEGTHTVHVEFQTPVLHNDSAPNVELFIPKVPISHFELLLPEKKEISVTPLSNIDYREEKGGVVATIFAPLTDSLTLSWKEAVPEEEKEDLRSSATYVHTFNAEEGVLYGRVLASYEITRGKGSMLEIDLPDGIQVNRITNPTVPVADWRILPAEEGAAPRLQVFFEHELSGELGFEVEYDLSVNPAQDGEGVPLPLLHSHDAHRQRGMIALLSSRELGLHPLEEQGVTKVGENQLPANAKGAGDKTVTHTYKYGDSAPTVKVQLAKPEHREGKFDAVAHTLFSLSDATMTASTNVEVNVKAGTIEEIKLELPANVNVLSVTAPSLRAQTVAVEGEKQIVDIQFTQDMEGQFRIELAYEKILSEKDGEVTAPSLVVRGAEVQQGKVAVEAISAVEVQPSSIAQLSSFDSNDLPKQLLLKTSNPILLSYSYVRADPPYRLGLKITRHREIEMQAAAIDGASYRTLFTRDGLAVTNARFMVRNGRKQFLRIDLPKGSKVWSAAVDGVAEKPALANEESAAVEAAPQVLLKIRTSAQPFPVDLVYQTPVAAARIFGTVRGILPRPDTVVTDSKWDVLLPDDLDYGVPRTNMKLVRAGEHIAPQEMESASLAGPLQIVVPSAGILYSFEKLYANQGVLDAFVEIPFTDKSGAWISKILMLLAGAAGALGVHRLLRGGRGGSVGLILGACVATYALYDRYGSDVKVALPVFIAGVALSLGERLYAYLRSEVSSEG